IGKDRTLSVPGQMYSYINVPVSEVLGALKNKVSVWWNAELLGITDKTVELVDYSLPYELLVSTLPAPVFWENYKVDKYRPAKLELEAVP
ncbi:MAG: hypothetical protein GWN31_11520, partial [Candidatus Thorarchaeota archaeon]|nr:hypothetical protein [Candidatus Thorarchaeota archaeon]NIW52605.1 hypothetical protein [Candidatus Korarchaeota archaeon]